MSGQICLLTSLRAAVARSGTGNLFAPNRETHDAEQGVSGGVQVSVHSSHTWQVPFSCDLSSTARFAEEERSRGQVDDHGDGGGAGGFLAVAS